MNTKNGDYVQLTPLVTLALAYVQLRIWLAFCNITLSRRKWLDEIADTIYEYEGVILTPEGDIWGVPDVDDVMGDPRWISLYKEEVDGLPKRGVRNLERLQMIDLYFQIKYPDIQRHFTR